MPIHNYAALSAALAGPISPMKMYKQFCLWTITSDGRKIPLTSAGYECSSTDPTTWCSADEALAAAPVLNCGVAFVFGECDPFTFIDIDKCLQADGTWSQKAIEVCAQFAGAAIEVSQSGRGLHIFTCGEVPANFSGRKYNGLECYTKWRFVALTGTNMQGSVLFNAGNVLHAFIEREFPKRDDVEGGALTWNVGPIEGWAGPSDDAALLQQFLAEPPRRTVADAFANVPGAPSVVSNERDVASNADLYKANVDVLRTTYPSDKGDDFDRSSAAFALATRLAYWTGKDCPRMERLMRAAAFQRTKADEFHSANETYMQWDIKRACALTTSVRRAIEAAVVEKSNYDYYADEIEKVQTRDEIQAMSPNIRRDKTLVSQDRILLAQRIQKRLELLGIGKLPIAECRRMTAVLVEATSEVDRKEMQKRINQELNLTKEYEITRQVYTTQQLLDEFVFVEQDDTVTSIYNRHMSYPLGSFRNTLAASFHIDDGKVIDHVEQWRTSIARKSVPRRTFHAGAQVFTTDPDGVTAINTWRPVTRASNLTPVDISPFLEHVQYLFGAETEPFLDWLAHIEQDPGTLPHYGWLHIADHFGCGRNWLESVIARLWRGYVAASVDLDKLINGNFNGQIAGRVIAVVDEIRAGAHDDAYMIEGKIRNMLTESSRRINPKYGKAYDEHNACRWLLFSNHKNAIPLSEGDRRWWVSHLTAAPRNPNVYSYLYGLLDNPAFIDSIAAWLLARDLRNFNPGQRPPVNEAKRKAVEASQSTFQKVARQLIEFWPSDLIDTHDLISAMSEGEISSHRISKAMKLALMDAGIQYMEKQAFGIDGRRHRVWCLRNYEKWAQNLGVLAAGPELEKIKQFHKGTGHATLSELI